MNRLWIASCTLLCLACHLHLPGRNDNPPGAASTAEPPATSRPDVEYKMLPVTLEGQETNLWCWATSGEMIMAAMGHPVTQCSQATERYGKKKDVNCCGLVSKLSQDAKSVCVRGGWPQFSAWGFESKNTKNDCEDTDHCALSWEDLVAEIDGDRPVAFSWRYEGGGGHMMVASGYVLIPPAGRYVVIDDPWPPHSGDSELITYERYVDGTYQHWRDYYDIRPATDGKGE